MKAFVFVLLCALAAVQGRYHGLQSTRSAAALGENPWVVHLRIAVSTSGLLETCVGSLIDNRWVLTSASCVSDARFIWVRYGAVNVVNPSLVTENSIVRVHPNADVALISINRYVQSTDNIAPISKLGEASDSGKVCVYGADVNGAPGEVLNCYEVIVEKGDDGSLAVSNDELQASTFDTGAPLVSDGAQVGVLVNVEDGVSQFVATAPLKDWIEQETGVSLSSDVTPEAVSFVQ